VTESCFDLVIFDCDGVLIDSEPIVNRAHVQTLAARGYVIAEEELLDRFCGSAPLSSSPTCASWRAPSPSCRNRGDFQVTC